jgi:glycosyltransferase involved in cell wall biosynthesis
MHILILNWRDIRNPQAGGAELLTHELAKYFVEQGHRVTQLSAAYPGSVPEEIIENVHIVRRGRWWNIHSIAFLYYLFGKFGHTDIIIDEVHWFPFFSKIYAPDKTVLLACEVAHTLFFNLFPYPLACIGRMVEKLYLYLYQDVPTLCISLSTKEDLVKEGFSPQRIAVLKLGLSIPTKIPTFKKMKRPTIMFLGRLNRQKGIFDAIDMFSIVHRIIPRSVLWIVGFGSEKAQFDIIEYLGNKGVYTAAVIHGMVSSEEKFKLLAKAHVLVVPSVHEGWGLVVPEAGMVRTPAIAYNVPGLKNTIDNKRTGILVDPNPQSLAKGVMEIIGKSSILERMGRAAQMKATTYNWKETGEQALAVIQAVHERNTHN